jgi:hypothetical protein
MHVIYHLLIIEMSLTLLQCAVMNAVATAATAAVYAIYIYQGVGRNKTLSW